MTPGRVFLAVALLGSAAVVIYGLFVDRSGGTIILTVVGLAILGITFAIIAVRLAAASVRAGQEGRGGRAVGSAFLGGLFALAASGSLGGAMILGLLARPI
ncbi:MAG: hypothetical protein H0V04_06990 [Chloroflexi bacterium]|nr:hypothetical protein [Chloroflexota bacterium]